MTASLKEYVIGFYRSLPVQLFLLHLRRYQILLIFWYILISAINGSFMSSFGADALFLAPEYMGEVNGVSMAIVGMATGVFIMSWNVTTFILHSNQVKFLATTSKPFLKYCTNNAVIPLLFLIIYIIRMIHFDLYSELFGGGEVVVLISGFLLGLVFTIVLAFLYFFRTEKTMMRTMEPVLRDPVTYAKQFGIGGKHFHERGILKVDWFFNTRFKLKKPRNVSHYSEEFIELVFKRHHFAAVFSIIVAFLILAFLGMLMDKPLFIIPAASAILLFFAVLIAGSGALSFWLKSWAFPVIILLVLVLNLLFEKDLIDPRNKAYGIDYVNRQERPGYNRVDILQLCSPEKMEADKQHMLTILEKWKAKQKEEKPVLYVVNVSGGGTRSATFTLSVLQQIDSMMNGFLDKVFVINGASGGMLGATYFRELFRLKQAGQDIDLQSLLYTENISKDLLNSLFSSFVTRDIFAPAQQFTSGNFTYTKDRGYAFEEQLNRNTGKILDYSLKDVAKDEANAKIPLMIFNSTITRDGRKMMISSQPISFMMRNWDTGADTVLSEPDAIDFGAMFRRQDPLNMRMLSVLRINATFPYVLPNVWMPSVPVIDVMDGGMRDNFGQESTLRMLNVFKDWIDGNTAGVVFIQIRDRIPGEWNDNYVDQSLTGLFTKPIVTLQNNWMKMQDYYQEEMVHFSAGGYQFPFRKIIFYYSPPPKEKGAALNFHLTQHEKQDIKRALNLEANRQSFEQLSVTGQLPETDK
ncbi:MAG: hypothetical protein KIT80_01870 [Chitinophagaceae bacterium]|nr:hypothetical protein [Chitinophagaceae bacterium]MCW5925631.1 hypothetical protein [Chitinophagaceae bacterium]